MANELAQSKNTEVRYGKQSAKGTPVAGGGAAKVARRASTAIVHTRNTFRSNEKRASGQVANEGHGQNMVSGDLVTELYSGEFFEFWAAVCQKDFVGITTVQATSGDGFTLVGSTGVLTRAAGSAQSFLTDGVRVGLIARLGAIATAGDVNRNLLVTAVTGTTVTLVPLDGVALTDIGVADENATLAFPGKMTYIPESGHTDDYLTVEDYKKDIDATTVFNDVKPGRANIQVSPNQPIQITFGCTGTGDADDGTGGQAPYFSAPTAAGNTVMFTSIRAYLRMAGGAIVIATGMNITIDRALQAPEVIASTVAPEVFVGAYADVTGSLTMFLKDHTMRNLFVNETETELVLVFEAPGSAPKHFFAVSLGRVKVNSATPDDPETGRVQTVNIRALEKPTTAGYTTTTLQLQDSAVA